MDHLEHGSEWRVLARPAVGDDWLEEGDHQDGEAEEGVQPLVLDGLELLVDDDRHEASEAEEDAEDHAHPVHMEPNSHAHDLLALLSSKLIKNKKNCRY